jgi:hypothetical protein
MEEAAVLAIARDFVRENYTSILSNLDLEKPSVRRISAEEGGKEYDFRATWRINYYYVNEPEGIDIFPHWVSIFVDDETGEPWLEKNGKPSRTSWRTRHWRDPRKNRRETRDRAE